MAWGVNPNDGTSHTSTVKLRGNGADWTVQTYRTGVVGDTQQARVAFKLSQTGSGAADYIGVYEDQGKLYLRTRVGASFTNQLTLMSGVDPTSWYVLEMAADEAAGFRVSVWQESDPSARYEARYEMPRGLSWRFHAWAYKGMLYLDGPNADGAYKEERPSRPTSDTRVAGQHYEYDYAANVQTKRYYAGGTLLATRSIPNANPNAQTLRYVQADHLGSTSTLTDSSGQVVARERYSAFGERRRGAAPLATDQLYTGQQYNSLSGLYHYSDGKSAGRFYDPLLARFVMADSITPGKGSQPLNRYAYNVGNPVRYTDPSGHWSEDQLAGTLGENWRDSYFGEGKVFEGRDNLLKFLTSENTTSEVVLKTMQPLMVAAAGMQSAGLPMNEVDAIGVRGVYTFGAAVFGGGSVDVLLNVAAGQFSVFGSPEVGFILGDSFSLTGGLTLIKNLPSNDAFRGTFMAGGLVGGDFVGMNAEVFWSSPMADSYNPFDQTHGGFLGAGGAVPSIGGYGAISYAWEMWREDSQGSHRIPYGFSPSNIKDIGQAIWHDVVLHPLWNPSSPGRR